MKQYIIFPKLLLLLIVILISACEDDPVVPNSSYRYATNEYEINNIPTNTFEGYNFDNLFLFNINKSIYIRGNAYYPINGEKPYRNSALYEYNTETKEWKIAWYLSEEKLNKSYDKEEDYQEIEQLRNIADCLFYSNYSNCCSYNNKGYICDQVMLEFDPSTNEIKMISSDSGVGMNDLNIGRLVSTSQGILIFDYNSYYDSKLYRYSFTTNTWEFCGIVDYDLIHYMANFDYRLSILEGNMYIWDCNGWPSHMRIYSYPYEKIKEEKEVRQPKDYGWNSYSYYYNNYYEKNIPVAINGKIYVRRGENAFYEYNPANNTVDLILLKNSMTDTYSYSYIPLCVIDNKFYFAFDHKIMEITF